MRAHGPLYGKKMDIGTISRVERSTRVGTHSGDDGRSKYTQARLHHWNEVARNLGTWRGWGGYYHRPLTQVLKPSPPIVLILVTLTHLVILT